MEGREREGGRQLQEKMTEKKKKLPSWESTLRALCHVTACCPITGQTGKKLHEVEEALHVFCFSITASSQCSLHHVTTEGGGDTSERITAAAAAVCAVFLGHDAILSTS